MSYRPISDLWFLARCKYKNDKHRYGGYLGGFCERARAMIGCGINDPVLHVCGGLARDYPYKGGFGPNDKTLDLDPAVAPDYLQNALDPLPGAWAGILIDPPYSEKDAEQYSPGPENYPSPYKLVTNALKSVDIGKKVGIIHYSLPKMPKDAKFVACAGVICGFGNRIRVFSVFQREQ